MLAQDLFWIDAQAGYSDSIIDAGQGTNYGGTGLFNRSNVEETGRASVTPRLSKQLGGFRFDASYTYGRVWYFESDDVAELRFDLHRLQPGLRGPARLRQSRHQRS